MPGRFNLEDYETVEQRLKRFYDDHPDGRIFTALLSDPNDTKQFMFRAEVYYDAADTIPKGTGHANEISGGGGANSTSACENAETSAIGRALANARYSGDKRASREEMVKVNRGPVDAPSRQYAPDRPATRPPTNGGEVIPCYKCSAPVRMGQGDSGKAERYNADGSLHFKTCGRGPTGYEADAAPTQANHTQPIEADPFTDE